MQSRPSGTESFASLFFGGVASAGRLSCLPELPYGAHARTSTCKIIASVACNILASPHPKGGHPKKGGACESVRLSPCVLVQPDGWARGEREGYGGPRGVTSLSLSLCPCLKQCVDVTTRKEVTVYWSPAGHKHFTQRASGRNKARRRSGARARPRRCRRSRSRRRGKHFFADRRPRG